MSLSGAMPFVPTWGGADGLPVRPSWLRPMALAIIVGAHALAFVTFRPAPATPAPSDSLEVTLLAPGDGLEEQKRQDEITPTEATPPVAAQAPEQKPEVAAPLPKIIDPDAVAVPVEKTEPVAQPQDKPGTPEEKSADPVSAQQRAAEDAQEGKQEILRGAQGRDARAGGGSEAAWVKLLVGEIRRHTFYPAAARAAHVAGAVGVAFTIGPAGRVTEISITRSSGSEVLDNAARKTLAALHTPPPPRGSYSTSTNINFRFK